MKLRSLLLVASITTSFAFGCAASSSDDSTEEAASGSEDALTNSPERTAQLDAVRVQVNKDFAGSQALRGYKLVFVVRRLNAEGNLGALQAHIMKRNAAGKDAELTDNDYKGSIYEEDIREGLFDGPEVTAGIEKVNGKWQIIEKAFPADDSISEPAGTRQAYVVGPTDVAYYTWDVDFGLKRSWLGL